VAKIPAPIALLNLAALIALSLTNWY